MLWMKGEEMVVLAGCWQRLVAKWLEMTRNAWNVIPGCQGHRRLG
jgi:hypothetical protein